MFSVARIVQVLIGQNMTGFLFEYNGFTTTYNQTLVIVD